jgi:hypothetical protein
METNITIWKLLTYVRPFFLSRWWDDLASTERLMFYYNATIQDIFNSDNAVYQYVYEELTWVLDWTQMKYTTSFPIRKIQDCINQNNMKMNPTLFWLTCCDLIRFDWNQIISDLETTSIKVTYIKDYQWASYPEDINEPIAVPYRYVPAIIKLMYDWGSPINLMSSESQVVDFFSHWQNRVNKLAENDSLTDFLNINPAY